MTFGMEKNKNPIDIFDQAFVSGKRDSNPRPSAWKADALSTELFPRLYLGLRKLGYAC